MNLSSGDRLGRYQIAGELGQGGMGEVYRARDTQLDREVAIKILPARFASDAAAAARFDQEARAVAALSHPNILAIYDVGRDAGVAFVVTELLEGETLRDRLQAGRLPLRKAIDLAGQIASGLAAAHAKGIVHRDVKPENIFITDDGHAKILDFGLAKVYAVDESEHTRTVAPTDPGTVMGTTGYLSPEQAQATSVDTRSDIFSFGVVCYEAVTGRRAFKGDSTIDTLHRIVHDQPPPIDEVQPDVPSELRWLLQKCLAKDPDERYQSTRDLVVDLKNVARALDSSPRLPVGPVASPPLRRGRGWIAAAAAVAVAVAALAVVLGTRVARERSTARTSTPGLSIERVTSLGTVIDAAISPDGKYAVYATSENARQGLSLRQLATGSTIELVPPLDGGMWGATFSPDGSAVYYSLFTSDEPTRAMYRVPILGGTPRKLVSGVDCQPTFSPDAKQMTWLRGDYPGRNESSLMVSDVDGQNARVLATRRPPEFFVPIFFTAAAWSPDGTRIVVPLWNASTRKGTLVAYRPTDGGPAPFPKYEWPAIGQANWLPDGSGLIVVAETETNRRNQLWLVGADREERRQITNDFQDYRRAMPTGDGSAVLAVAMEGSSTIWVAPIDGDGEPQRVRSARSDGINGLAALRDGRILYRSLESGTASIWVMNRDGSHRMQVTTDGVSAWPAAAPDGRSLVYAREGSGLWLIGIDGREPRALPGTDGSSFPQFAPDGRTLFYTGSPSGAGAENLFSVSIDGGPPRTVLDVNATGMRSGVSPDGARLAFYYRERGHPTVLAIMPIGGSRPTNTFDVAPSLANALVRWTADGKGLLHNSGLSDRANIWLQPVAGGAPQQVTHFSDQVIFGFDPSPDGKTLVIARGTLTRDALLIRNFR
jgi:eukaryotic-like serine/threonine-protein kinase